jgi:RES domain-containing protein
VKLYRARAWRAGPATFDSLDSTGSVSGPQGWRFNDVKTEILYTAQVEALAILEVAVRPGWETIQQILIATIEIPDDSVADLRDLGIVLPRNWNARPVAADSRTVARAFLEAVAAWPPGAPKPMGLRVPSVLSRSDFNVLVDPSRKGDCTAAVTSRIPFNTLRATRS